MRSYPGSMQLFGQGELASDVYLIRRGAIKLVWTDIEGRETIVGLRWPGSFLGLPAIIAGLPNPATAVTLTPCTVEQVPGGRFLQMLRANALLAMRVHEAQSREIVEQTLDLGELAIVSAKMRFISLLQRLTGSVSSQVCLPDGRLRLPLKKKELAALLAVTPEHLSRMLNELASEGVIAINRQWIIIRNLSDASGTAADNVSTTGRVGRLVSHTG